MKKPTEEELELSANLNTWLLVFCALEEYSYTFNGRVEQNLKRRMNQMQKKIRPVVEAIRSVDGIDDSGTFFDTSKEKLIDIFTEMADKQFEVLKEDVNGKGFHDS